MGGIENVTLHESTVCKQLFSLYFTIWRFEPSTVRLGSASLPKVVKALSQHAADERLSLIVCGRCTILAQHHLLLSLHAFDLHRWRLSFYVRAFQMEQVVIAFKSRRRKVAKEKGIHGYLAMFDLSSAYLFQDRVLGCSEAFTLSLVIH